MGLKRRRKRWRMGCSSKERMRIVSRREWLCMVSIVRSIGSIRWLLKISGKCTQVLMEESPKWPIRVFVSKFSKVSSLDFLVPMEQARPPLSLRSQVCSSRPLVTPGSLATISRPTWNWFSSRSVSAPSLTSFGTS